MKCDRCYSVTINGVFCHERGCPDEGKEWRDGEWVSTYECPECGSKYLDRQDAAECCAPVEPKFREAKMVLLCDGASGIYIPRDFATGIKRECLSGVDPADLDYLARGPEDTEAAESYWDTWETVCDNALVTATDGTVYTLYQDGDLWLVEQGAELNDSDLGPDVTGCDTMFVVRL